MRTSLYYILSACFHGSLLWLVAAADMSWQVDYAVRSGRAGAPGMPGTPQIECILDSHIELPEPVDAAVETVAMANVPQPAPAATPAAIDGRVVAHASAAGEFRRRTLTGRDVVTSIEAAAVESALQDAAPTNELLVSLPTKSVSEQPSELIAQIVSGTVTDAQSPAPTPRVIEVAPSPRTGQGGQGATGAQVDRLPGPLPSNPEPVYPEELRRQQIGGTVLLRVVISADGTVEKVTLEKTSGHRQLDDSALATVKVWRFQPPRRGGIPTRFEALLPITFAIRANTAAR